MTEVLSRRLPRRLDVVAGWALPPLLMAFLAVRVGPEPFLLAGQVISPVPVVAALLLGLLAAVAQAMRWRAVARAYGAAQGLTVTRAVQECYRAALLNLALPGGLAGDAVRVWRRRDLGAPPDDAGQLAGRRRRTLRAAAGSVVVERVTGTALLLCAAVGALFALDRRMSPALLAVSAMAGVAVAVTVPGLARLSARARLAVVGWSALVLVALLGLFAVAVLELGHVAGNRVNLSSPTDVAALGVILLAGSSLPLGFAGFGPRETVAVFVATTIGLAPRAGVTLAAAFGILAVVSVLPGALVMLLGRRR